MQRLLFFSRVALICNICFLITFFIHYIPAIANGVIPSTIIIIGNVLAIVINVLLNIIYGLFMLTGKPISQYLPKWLAVVNFFFFILQVILLLR